MKANVQQVLQFDLAVHIAHVLLAQTTHRVWHEWTCAWTDTEHIFVELQCSQILVSVTKSAM